MTLPNIFKLKRKPKQLPSLKTVTVDTFFDALENGNYEAVGGGDNFVIIYEQYFDSMGVSDDLKLLISKKKSKIYWLKRTALESRHFQAMVDNVQAEIDEILSNSKAGQAFDLFTTCASISKFMGIAINASTTTMAEFVGYVKLMNKAAKETPKDVRSGKI